MRRGQTAVQISSELINQPPPIHPPFSILHPSPASTKLFDWGTWIWSRLSTFGVLQLHIRLLANLQRFRTVYQPH